MELIKYKDGIYRTSVKKRTVFKGGLLTVSFYLQVLPVLYGAGAKAKAGKATNIEIIRSCYGIVEVLERNGVEIEISGIDNLKSVRDSCVLVANHMSTLETFVLPSIILPYKDVSFVVKKSLLKFPMIGHILKHTQSIAVTRKNAREDLTTVLKEGVSYLRNGTSVAIFPQATRTKTLIPEKFNALGVKLAKKAEVPVIPLALKTDAWGTGRYLRDLGKFDNSKKVHFAFGSPILIKDTGKEEHRAVIQFISGKLRDWEASSIA